LLENGRIRVFNGRPDLLFRGIWSDDAVLALSRSLGVPTELCLEILVLVDGCLQPAVHLSDLRGISRVARLGLGFDVLHAGDEGAVARHDLGAHVRNLRRGHVRTGQDLLEHALQRVELAVNLVEGAVDLSALVQNRIGICAH
jgi:hypothetical protein